MYNHDCSCPTIKFSFVYRIILNSPLKYPMFSELTTVLYLPLAFRLTMFSLNSMISLHSLALDLSRYFSLWNNLFFKNLSFVYCWYSFYFTCYFFVEFFLMCSFPHWLLVFIQELWGYVQLQFLLHSKFKYYTSNSFSNSSFTKEAYAKFILWSVKFRS